jgi:hypothetical protein
MSAAMFDDMKPEEYIEYLRLDRIIQKGEESFFEWVNCLMIMRDKKLYRKNYKTFEEYCQKKLSKSRQYINGLIKGVAAVKALPKHLESMLSNPRASAALASVPKEDQSKVVEEIKKEGKPATAKAIKEKAAEVAKPKVEKVEPPKIRCETGCVIPKDLEGLWSRRNEVKELMASISEVKCHIEAAIKDKDPLYGEIKNDLVAQLGQVRHGIGYAMPYAICKCNGKLRSTCLICHGRGFVSKQRYETFDDDYKKMRALMKDKNGNSQ